MRITIDIDDRTVATGSQGESRQTQSAGGDVSPENAGAGPAGSPDLSSGSALQTDSGGPPSWLLNDIAAAEMARRDASPGDDNEHAADAGAAPASH